MASEFLPSDVRERDLEVVQVLVLPLCSVIPILVPVLVGRGYIDEFVVRETVWVPMGLSVGPLRFPVPRNLPVIDLEENRSAGSGVV
jgi:hypothetical protein